MAAIVLGASDAHEDSGGGAEGGGLPAPRPATDPFEPHLAKSVTRQVQISGPANWKHLLSGVDSLDLGLYVEWPARWPEIEKSLLVGKEEAAGTKGIRWTKAPQDGCLILPGGKPPMYAFHLQTADFHLFMSRNQRTRKYPNVYVSTLAQSLWLKGVRPTIARVEQFIHRLGGRVERIQVSRCDLSADFLIPGGLGLDFLRALKVSRARAWRPFNEGEQLQTFYVGGNGSDLQCRIYDKALEVSRDGLKAWFIDLWKIEELKDVWRIEFQLRREVLKQFGVDTFDDLVERAGGIWETLTSSWLSFRFNDDENATRRTPHPWWQAVQSVAGDFGSEIAIARNYDRPKAALVDWFISHAAGCLVGYAARLDLPNLPDVFRSFLAHAGEYWARKDFAERYRIERIALGFDDVAKGGQP